MRAQKIRLIDVEGTRTCFPLIFSAQRNHLNESCVLSFYQQCDDAYLLGLLDLILYDPSTIFQLNRDGFSWVKPLTKLG